MPIADRHIDYARKVEEKLKSAGLRTEVDSRNEKVGFKIREAELQKVPYMLIVGDKELETGKVSVRSKNEGDLGQQDPDSLIEHMQNEI